MHFHPLVKFLFTSFVAAALILLGVGVLALGSLGLFVVLQIVSSRVPNVDTPWTFLSILVAAVTYVAVVANRKKD